jgi:alkylmercury lyase
MNESETLATVLEAWQSISKDVPQEALDFEVRLTALTVRLLAKGRPVSAEQLAESWNMPLDQVLTILDQARGNTIEVDDNGDLISAGGLSLSPTPHHLILQDKTLYAWCAFDAMFLPGFLGQRLEIESIDPIRGDPIRMTITPLGIESFSPDSTVLSIAIPGDSCAIEQLGPESEACGQMHFFSSPDSAQVWLNQHPGSVMLTAEQAYQAAYTNWLIRLPDEFKVKEEI